MNYVVYIVWYKIQYKTIVVQLTPPEYEREERKRDRSAQFGLLFSQLLGLLGFHFPSKAQSPSLHKCPLTNNFNNFTALHVQLCTRCKGLWESQTGWKSCSISLNTSGLVLKLLPTVRYSNQFELNWIVLIQWARPVYWVALWLW